MNFTTSKIDRKKPLVTSSMIDKIDGKTTWQELKKMSKFPINQDKKSLKNIDSIEELAMEYLNQSSFIKQKTIKTSPPAPPVVKKSTNTNPLQYLFIPRASPKPKTQIEPKLVTIFTKQNPPTPRKILFEHEPMPNQPSKAQYEKSSSYRKLKAKIIQQKEKIQNKIKPKNVIVQWEPPELVIKKDIIYLGVVRTDPDEYVKKYGPSLKAPEDLPSYVNAIKTPEGITLAAKQIKRQVCEPSKGVCEFRISDLKRENLKDDKKLRKSKCSISDFSDYKHLADNIKRFKKYILAEIFAWVNLNGSEKLTRKELGKHILKFNKIWGQNYDKKDIEGLFDHLDLEKNGKVEVNTFFSALEKLNK